MRMLFLLIVFLQGLLSVTNMVMLVGDPFAIQGQNYTLYCLRANMSPAAEVDWYKDGIIYDAVLCSPLVGICVPSQIGRYEFSIDKNGMYINITGLRRYEDERQWKCTYKVQGSPLEEATMNLIISIIPASGLIYTLKPTSSADLSLSAVMLECVTSECIYPVPVINWYYKDANPPGLVTLYKTTGTQTAGGNCTSPENVYSSRLELPLNTTWSDNSEKSVKFSCGIEYPKPLGTVYSPDSSTITFAIRVTWVELRQNNVAVSDTILTVTSGESVTLTCVTGMSRPDPTIVWLIENQNKGNGANLTFIPADTDHDKMIYCRAYNTDPNLTVESVKPKIFVRESPKVIIETHNGTYNEKRLMIKCLAHGISEQYTFRLTHGSLFSGIKIRQLSFEYVSIGVIIYQFTNPTFMDTGVYTCSVSNGIPDYSDGSIDKSVNGTTWITDIPRVTSIDRSFYAENGHSGRLIIELYSSLLDPQVRWYKHNSGTLDKLQGSEKYNIILSSSLVNVDFYSVTILQPGYIATLEIKNVTKDDFGSYQVHVQNSVGEMSPIMLILKAAASEAQYASRNGLDGALLGGVLGSTLLVSIVVAIVGVMLYRRRNKSPDNQLRKESTSKDEHKLSQNSKRDEEHYEELEHIEQAANNQARSPTSTVYETLTKNENIQEHAYSYLTNTSCSVVKKPNETANNSKTRSVERRKS